jgi:hypothetical protein
MCMVLLCWSRVCPRLEPRFSSLKGFISTYDEIYVVRMIVEWLLKMDPMKTRGNCICAVTMTVGFVSLM